MVFLFVRKYDLFVYCFWLRNCIVYYRFFIKWLNINYKFKYFFSLICFLLIYFEILMK